MGIGDWFKSKTGNAAPKPLSDEMRATLQAYVEAMESGALQIPDDMHDKTAWDNYWRKQWEVGAIDQGFNDAMASDKDLIPLLDRRSVKTVLCVGIGFSKEALSLALHGFDVTALDLSELPWVAIHTDVLSGAIRHLPGFRIRDDHTMVLPELADAELLPKIHRSPDRPPRGGGALRCVVGDLTDLAVCPGPFDAVIERRTVQLFPPAERHAALDALVSRLASRALFVSHQHRGAWRPGESREHFASDWVAQSGFTVDMRPQGSDIERQAWLWYSTG